MVGEWRGAEGEARRPMRWGKMVSYPETGKWQQGREGSKRARAELDLGCRINRM